jgi:DNA-3-methyladenine glycosylase
MTQVMKNKWAKLKRDFFMQPTEEVARQLLGKVLIYKVNSNTVLAGLIVETEAYLGLRDPACHSYGGRKTKRNATLYMMGGHSYIYFVYGMHYCFNIVTRSESEPEAVLVRALEPLQGIETMKVNRGNTKLTSLTNGPAKLCQALKLTTAFDKIDLVHNKSILFIAESHRRPSTIERGPRIGIDYAGKATSWPLRFFYSDNPFVSKGKST